MLPMISINVNDICRNESWHSGIAYLYDFNTVTDAARSEGMSLDSFLTLKIGYALTRKKLRSNILLCYTSYQGLFVLTVCSKHKADLPDLISLLPDCLEFGREDSIPTRAAPFIFYGGLQIYRLYSVREQPATGYYVCDCALCDLLHSKREKWVRGEKRDSGLFTTPKTAEVETGIHRKTGYSLYLRHYQRGENTFINFDLNYSLSQSGYYVCDMGCVYGMCLAEAEKDDYEEIRDRPDQSVDYSAVPFHPSEEFIVDGTNFTLQHTLCKWIR